ncbi:MAG: hypothetical protein E5X73_25230 [Mesorhizobium sp.]|nr:MAG: hypothetical protein E5X73_25230 [Mesorhizobium sp.]
MMRFWPQWLKPSAMVDLRQVMLDLRPALRTEISGAVGEAELGRWARLNGLYYCRDSDNFIVFSKRPALARRVLTIDQTVGEHSAWLGHWLGYPPCCVRAARRVGEKNLDSWSRQLASRHHVGNFASIMVDGYAAGRALISHIPCSPHCSASLRLASQLVKPHSPAQRPSTLAKLRGFHADGRRHSLPQ